MPNEQSRQSGGTTTQANGSSGGAPEVDRGGLRIPRLFTKPGTHPYEEITWERRKASIVARDGRISFEQDDVEFPSTWSLNATNIVAEKYFRGKLNTPEREHSVKQIIDRVVGSVCRWGEEQGRFATADDRETFRAELTSILVNQRASFNSPVWFNIGVAGRSQQASACQPYHALVSTPDGLIPIGRLVADNAVGAKVFDSHGVTKVVAVKANGEKRVLRVHTSDGYALDVTDDHVVWKAGAGWVTAGELRPGDGLSWHGAESWGDGEISHRETSKASQAGAYVAREGAEGRVPGLLLTAPLPVVSAFLRSLFDVAGDVENGEVILDSASEYVARGAQTLLTRYGVRSVVSFKPYDADGDGLWSMRVADASGRRRFADEIGFADAARAEALEASITGTAGPREAELTISSIEDLGVMDVYDIQTESGEYLSGNIRVHNCFILHVDDNMESIAEWYRDEMFIFKGGSGAGLNVSNLRSSYEQMSTGGYSSGPVSFMRGADASAGTIKSGGATRRAAKMVVMNIDHPDLIECRDGAPGFIWTKAVEERKARALKAAGFDVAVDSGVDSYSLQYQNANNSVRVTDEFMKAYAEDRDWHLRAVTTGEVVQTYMARDIMRQVAQAAWECADPGVQYHTTINDWHTIPAAGPITASNPCSEYLSIDNSPCNLASLNLLKFLDENGHFDTQAFEHAVSTVLLGQAILCVAADYPTDKIAKNARGFRQLGIGYANLGALLMALGVPYDSDEGRAWAASITALMQGAAYRASARFAQVVGPFPGTDELPGYAHPENRSATQRVLKKHAAFARVITRPPTDEERSLDARVDVFRDEIVGAGRPLEADPELSQVAQRAVAVWDECLELAGQFGVENSQVSVQAPTGTISFKLDCDTTGIEPDLALKKVKKLVGGGTMSIVNQTVPRALRRLGYKEEQVEAIVAYIDEENTVVGAPALKPEHYPVFACSFTSDNLIGYMGHIRMMAAIQPSVSGALSKTINMPEDASVEDVEDVYGEGWRLGLKALAIYRDNCKADQPLSAETKKVVDGLVSVEPTTPQPVRRRLPQTRPSVTFSFRVADCEGYVHVGLYPETRQPGELFIKVAKQGSTLAGVMDAFSISISMGLQYGVPLEAYIEKFTNMIFEPRGITDDAEIRFAASLMDYIFRKLAVEFLPPERRHSLGIKTTAEREDELNGHGNGNGMNQVSFDRVSDDDRSAPLGPRSSAETVDQPALDAPLCNNCGVKMRPSGSCFACELCGSTSGCS